MDGLHYNNNHVYSHACHGRVFHVGHSTLLDYYATIYGTQYVEPW